MFISPLPVSTGPLGVSAYSLGSGGPAGQEVMVLDGRMFKLIKMYS